MLTTPEQIAPRRAGTLQRRRGGASFPILAILATLSGLALGLGSARYALDRNYPFGGVHAGPWLLWPRVGSREIDPYARAIVSRRGELPLGVGEGIALHARTDDSGRALDPSCIYTIGPGVPQTRAWTLTAYDGQGRAQDELGRVFSGGIVRKPDGGFEIAAAREVQAGNWLRLPAQEPITLVLRLYDTPIVAGAAALDPASVPRIERLGCAS